LICFLDAPQFQEKSFRGGVHCRESVIAGVDVKRDSCLFVASAFEAFAGRNRSTAASAPFRRAGIIKQGLETHFEIARHRRTCQKCRA
jgi:hypothetical protein